MSIIGLAKVLFDFTGETDSELSVTVGEEITVLVGGQDNWTLGRNAQGKEGFFPSDYVEFLQVYDPPLEDPNAYVAEAAEEQNVDAEDAAGYYDDNRLEMDNNQTNIDNDDNEDNNNNNDTPETNPAYVNSDVPNTNNKFDLEIDNGDIPAVVYDDDDDEDVSGFSTPSLIGADDDLDMVSAKKPTATTSVPPTTKNGTKVSSPKPIQTKSDEELMKGVQMDANGVLLIKCLDTGESVPVSKLEKELEIAETSLKKAARTADTLHSYSARSRGPTSEMCMSLVRAEGLPERKRLKFISDEPPFCHIQIISRGEVLGEHLAENLEEDYGGSHISFPVSTISFNIPQGINKVLLKAEIFRKKRFRRHLLCWGSVQLEHGEEREDILAIPLAKPNNGEHRRRGDLYMAIMW